HSAALAVLVPRFFGLARGSFPGGPFVQVRTPGPTSAIRRRPRPDQQEPRAEEGEEMKRIATSVVSFVVVVGALAPAAGASDQGNVVFAGSGSARALDLSLPVLGALPLVGSLTNAANFRGLTAGVTSAQFGSD